MAQAGMEEHEAIKVGVVGIEEVGFVQSVVVLNKCTYLHLMAYSVLHNCSERVARCSYG